MKLVIFGLTITSAWGNGHATPNRAILRALHRHGHQITFYEKDVPYYASRRDFERCDYCDLVLYPDWNTIRQDALADVSMADAVIVASYCPEGARISDEVLELQRPLRVFYDMDAPITLARLAHSDLEYLRRDQIPEFDLYLSFTGGSILCELEQCWGAQCARPLYGCVDPDVHFRVPVRKEFQSVLSYMGTYAPDRQPKLDQLFLEPCRQIPGGTFVLAGPLYPREWLWPKNVRRFDHVAPIDHSALYSSSRATLNITREDMRRSGYCPSGRFFEAAACGTPILSDWWEGLDTFFSPGEQIFTVDKSEDVIAVLRSPDFQITEVAQAARARALDEHTGQVRARSLLGFLEEARSRTSAAVASREVFS